MQREKIMNLKRTDVLYTINGTIFVVDDPKQTKTKGGIILSDNAEGDRMITGTILEVSPFLLEDGSLRDPGVKVGQAVLYGQHSGAGCVWVDEIDKRTYRMIKWNEILAVIKNEKGV
jgi:co-chaperonin GroES (HSP10)